MILKQRISPSFINSFEQCSLKWNYTQHEEYPKLPIYIEAADEGIEIHEAIKTYFDNVIDRPTKDQVRKLATMSFESVVGTLKAKTKRCLENFISFELKRLVTWKTYKPEMVETRITLDQTELFNYFAIQSPVEATNIIDFYCDGVLIDWKTGNISYIDEDIMFQLMFGRLFLEAKNHKVRKMLVVAINSGLELECPVSSRTWFIDRIEKILKKISDGNFIPTKSPLCNYCEYQLRCEYENTSISDIIKKNILLTYKMLDLMK